MATGTRVETSWERDAEVWVFAAGWLMMTAISG